MQLHSKNCFHLYIYCFCCQTTKWIWNDCCQMKSNPNKIMTIAVLWFQLYLHVKLENQHTCWLGNGPEYDHWHPPQRGKSQRVITGRGGLFKECCIKAYKMQSWLERRNWVGKCAQATGMTASLRILSSKADLNTWESFTGVNWTGVSASRVTTLDIFRKRATKPLLKQKHVRSILLG